MEYHRKIRCPRHFVLKNGKDPRTGLQFTAFKMMRNPHLKNVPEWAFQKWPSLIRYVPVRDKWGRKIRDDASFYQPLQSAAFFLYQVYDPRNPICSVQCKRRCTEGIGTHECNKNKRLNGPKVYEKSVS